MMQGALIVLWLACGLCASRWSGPRLRDEKDALMLVLFALCGPVLLVSVLVELAFERWGRRS